MRRPPATTDDLKVARTFVRARADKMAADMPRMSRVRALALVRYAADELVAEQVRAERESRRTWDSIGRDLGISWQAARQRYKDRP